MGSGGGPVWFCWRRCAPPRPAEATRPVPISHDHRSRRSCDRNRCLMGVGVEKEEVEGNPTHQPAGPDRNRLLNSHPFAVSGYIVDQSRLYSLEGFSLERSGDIIST